MLLCMSSAPDYSIDPLAFAHDPYPDLARMQALGPVVAVPQLGAVLLTRRDDIHRWEKRVDVFSSHQPGGLMTQLMGENMMRRDGEAHRAERRAIFPALSPRIVRQVWEGAFRAACAQVLRDLRPRGAADLVVDFAMPVSGAALVAVTGLAMTPAQMDWASQAMIDGCANYAGDAAVEAACNRATAFLDACIAARWADARDDHSVVSVLRAAGLARDRVAANVKLVISGGQNEPRDAIAGTAAAVLAHDGALAAVARLGWGAAFDEYLRWMAPIGMSPRRVACDAQVEGVDLVEGQRAFLMFGAANRDPRHFEAPDQFRVGRAGGGAIPFGAGPHFCAGAAVSRCLVADIALPMLFQALPGLRLSAPVRHHGWAFRGPVSVPVVWDV